MSPVRYRISASNPHAHLYEVSCTVADPDPTGQVFRLPAWVPGSYLIREFARHFIALRATCAGLPVAVVKTAKDVWQVAPCDGPLTLTAEVYAFDLSVRAAFLDATRGFFNGPSVFVWPVGHEEHPCELEIVVALHAGTVIYGNVGAADRLDFTVIGPAVNLVSRVEHVAKTLDEPIVVTDDFARAYGGALRTLGRHTLRGLSIPRELFAPETA